MGMAVASASSSAPAARGVAALSSSLRQKLQLPNAPHSDEIALAADKSVQITCQKVCLALLRHALACALSCFPFVFCPWKAHGRAYTFFAISFSMLPFHFALVSSAAGQVWMGEQTVLVVCVSNLVAQALQSMVLQLQLPNFIGVQAACDCEPSAQSVPSSTAGPGSIPAVAWNVVEINATQTLVRFALALSLFFWFLRFGIDVVMACVQVLSLQPVEMTCVRTPWQVAGQLSYTQQHYDQLQQHALRFAIDVSITDLLRPVPSVTTQQYGQMWKQMPNVQECKFTVSAFCFFPAVALVANLRLCCCCSRFPPAAAPPPQTSWRAFARS